MKKIKLSNVRTFFRSLFSYCLGLCILLIFGPLLLMLVSLPASWRHENKFLYRVADLFYKSVVWAMLMPVKIEGLQNLPTEPAVIIGNHQSSLDIPILGSVLNGYPHVWLALIDFINTPVLGYIIKKMGVWVDRRTPVAAARTVLQGLRQANKLKAHIVLYPEGGRFIDGKVHEFLGGFSLIARRSGRKVIPIYMPYNYKIFPPGSFLLGYHQMKIIIGPPFEVRQDETDKDFVTRVHQWFDKKVREFVK